MANSTHEKTQGRCPHTLSRGLTSLIERSKTAPLGYLRKTCAARGAFLPSVPIVKWSVSAETLTVKQPSYLIFLL
jgi:hypothetical protein